MKSLAKPRYTQEQYDQASAVYMRWCYVQALREGRPVPSKPARLPLLRPTYGREVAGVAKAVSMHLGVSVHLIRFIFVITTFFFGAGAIAYIFLWITVPVGDPVQQAYVIAGSQPVENAPLSHGNVRNVRNLRNVGNGRAIARQRRQRGRHAIRQRSTIVRKPGTDVRQRAETRAAGHGGTAYAGPMRGDGGERH